MADVKDHIEKYLKGELSQAEMHSLEKRALKDPFLADALEGAASMAPGDFVADVAELRRRVVTQQKARRTWITPLRIAAAMALLIAASYLIYIFVRPDEPVTIAQTVSKEPPAPSKENRIGDSVSTTAKEKTEPGLLSLDQPAPSLPKRKAIEELKPTSDPARLAVSSGDGKAGPGEISSADQIQELKLAEAKTDEAPAGESDKALKQEESLKMKKDVALQKAFRSSGQAGAPVVLPSRRVISGLVTSADDGTPIQGANVIIEGTLSGTVSDANGKYQVITNTHEDSLVISSIGYETREIKVPAGQSKVNVALPADASQLSEVIITSYGISDRKSEREGEMESPVQFAEPKGGKGAYNIYLEKNLHYPQQAFEQKIEGKVTIEFTVEPTGVLSDFKVVHGLDYGCNEEVIRLVKGGPPWKPSTQAKAKLKSTVRVRVRFKLPK